MSWLLMLAAALPLRAAQTDVNPLQLRVHHVTAAVVDIDRAVRWYRDMLGFQVLDRGSRMNGAMQFAELAIPGFGIGLLQLAAAVPRAVDPAKSVAPSWVHIVFSVPDPDATFRLLKSRGADVFTRGPVQGPVTTFLARDSEGNEIEFVTSGSQ
ncbi:MAG: VOC family protein [Steroidobacteraceae bacterium]